MYYVRYGGTRLREARDMDELISDVRTIVKPIRYLREINVSQEIYTEFNTNAKFFVTKGYINDRNNKLSFVCFRDDEDESIRHVDIKLDLSLTGKTILVKG